MKRKSICAAVVKEIRIKNWLKNVFVISPLVFSLQLFDMEKLTAALLLTIAFCFVSSSIYIFNDLNDRENDRKHEVKKNRPIASGEISVGCARMLFCVLLISGLCLTAWTSINALAFVLAYVIINIMYSLYLKKKAVIDCFCIAAGFVLRVLVGGTIVSFGVSHWMFLTVVSLSLFMAFGKRRGELCNYEGGETRAVLDEYDGIFLDGSVFMCAGLTLVFYSLWSISQESQLVYTVPIVLFIVSRYLLLVFKGSAEADPTSLILSDTCLWVSCGICSLVMIALLYVPQML